MSSSRAQNTGNLRRSERIRSQRTRAEEPTVTPIPVLTHSGRIAYITPVTINIGLRDTRHLTAPRNSNAEQDRSLLPYNRYTQERYTSSEVGRLLQSNGNFTELVEAMIVPDVDTFLSEAPEPVIQIPWFDSSELFPQVEPKVTKIRRNKSSRFIKDLGCAVCLEENAGNVILEPCKHRELCDTCINKWKAQTCPICRAQIKTITIFT